MASTDRILSVAGPVVVIPIGRRASQRPMNEVSPTRVIDVIGAGCREAEVWIIAGGEAVLIGTVRG
jgi:hypothetical protein